ncbi:TonB-dependent receptor [Sphingomonas oleivorans]|uniref:TonB-dependent receptor n=1 Tax=Sphingomonas oleivorans TaxID=1735121 RepID=UPI0013FDEB8E|nr:TonB-dependent receptor [Sphingomonas oleivorans]
MTGGFQVIDKTIRSFMAATAVALALAHVAPAQSQMRNFNIPEQPLRSAIAELGVQSGLQLLVSDADLANRQAPPIRGEMDARAALRRLIAGSGLSIASDDGRTILLTRKETPRPFAPAAPETTNEETAIVVTGDRLSQALSIQTKRDAFTVTDAISSDDIGKLPDHNSAAALRRIPGVSTQEDQGEPRFPVLRGLSSTYNRTSINGSIVASVDNSARTVPLDIVPSTLASKLEVIKTITPDLDPNAIGGTINIVTKSAFSEDGFFFYGQGALGDYQQSGEIRGDKLSWRANATTGTRFGPDGQFGLVASLSYQIRDSDIPQVETASPSYRQYTAAGVPVALNAANGNGNLVPVQQRLFVYNNRRERLGGALALEWQPDTSFYVRAFGSYNRMEDDEERSENRIEPSGNVSGQTPTGGSLATGRNIVGLGRFQINRSIWTGQLSARYEPNDMLHWETDLVYSGAELDNPESTEEFATPASGMFGFDYDFDNFFFKFRPRNQAAVDDPANYRFSSRTELQRGSQEDVYEARSALSFSTDSIADRATLKLGGVYRSTARDADQDFTSLTLPASAGLNYTLADASGRMPIDVVGGYRFGLRIDSDKANDFAAANRARFTASSSNISSDYQVDEDVYGGFIQAQIELGALNLLGGVRYERTDVDSSGARIVNNGPTPVTRSGSYDNWLPSVHLRWNAAPRLVLRGAYTNTIGRPDFGSIAARESISLPGGGIPTLSRGNPDLKPRESEGLDASIEYYPSGGMISLAIFHKKIKNEIYTLTSLERIDLGIGRGVEDVNVTQARNIESAKIFGIEAGLQQALTFLPSPLDGFGVNLNATYVNSDVNYRTSPTSVRDPGLFLQPEWIANAQLYYQRGGFEGRVSYNYIGGFLETINATIPAADQYWRERSTVDAQISYRLNRHVELFVEGENLTNAGRRELTGPNRDLLQEAATYGRAFWAGASARF